MKCAIYTRKSTTHGLGQEFTSLDAQRDSCLNYIASHKNEGWVALEDLYNDGGFTGANMERPHLEKLIGDIQKGKVDCVVVYKVDRMSRSLLDFCKLLEFFEKHQVGFVSVTQHFDTNTSMGRLTLNILLSFAQFEREMISERIKDKFEQRAQRGMYNGGRAPFGYKKVDKKLVVDKKDTKIVKSIFEEFVSSGSLQKTVNFVRENNILHHATNSPLTISGIFQLLRNPVYTGKIKWNDKIYDGQHETIISNDLFQEAQDLMTEKVKGKRLYKGFFLSKLIKCSECGSSMTNTFTNKKKKRYYYYKCVKVVKEGSHACSVKEVNSEKLEAFLAENLSRIAGDSQYIENLVFRLAHKSHDQGGFELTEECSKNLVTRVQEVLINFKNKALKGSQMEKSILFQKTIKKIYFSRHQLEVLINIEDTNREGVLNLSGLESGKRAARIRGARPNSCAPVCTSSFGTKELRREEDSNLRSLSAYTLSRRAHSTTLPSLPKFRTL